MKRQWGLRALTVPKYGKQRDSRAVAFCTVRLFGVTWECCSGTGCSYLLCHAGGRSQGGTATESPALPGAPPGVVLLQAAQCKTEPEGSSELIASILQKSYFLVITLT